MLSPCNRIEKAKVPTRSVEVILARPFKAGIGFIIA